MPWMPSFLSCSRSASEFTVWVYICTPVGARAAARVPLTARSLGIVMAQGRNAWVNALTVRSSYSVTYRVRMMSR